MTTDYTFQRWLLRVLDSVQTQYLYDEVLDTSLSLVSSTQAPTQGPTIP